MNEMTKVDKVTTIDKEQKKRQSKFPFRTVLVLLFLLQLGGAGYAIWKQYYTQNKGEAFLFQTRPIDPYDQFRGKYVALNFEMEKYYPFSGCQNEDNLYIGDILYVNIKKDDKGVAKVTKLTEQKPKGAYLKVDSRWCGHGENEGEMRFSLPFRRYYANENEAFSIERQARENPEETFLKVWIHESDYSVDELILPKI